MKTPIFFNGIKKRILITIIPLMLLCVFSAITGMIIVMRGGIWPIYEKSVLTGLEALAGEIAHYNLEKQSLKNILAKYRKSKSRHFVVGKNKQVIYSSDGVMDAEDLLHQGEALIAGKRSGITLIKYLGTVKGILAATRLKENSLLVLFVDTIQLRKLKFKGAIIIIVIVITGMAGVAITMIYFIINPFLQRLHLLKKSIKMFGTGKKEVRLPGQHAKHDEFDIIFNEFNRMADTITQFEQQKRHEEEEKKALLAQLAHDINTPIAILRANAENLMEYANEINAEKKQSLYTDILAQSIYIQSLVDDLLTMASVQVSSLSVHPEAVSLDELFDSIVDTFQPLVEKKGIVIVADGKNLSVWADVIRTRQIMTNLVKNAIVHGKKVTLIEIYAKKINGKVLITVKDNGSGIPDEMVPEIFERYHKGKYQQSSGWGLGLSIVKMLSKLQGGTCKYCGSGNGAIFEIILPTPP